MKKIVFSATGRTMAIADMFCSVFDENRFIDLSRPDLEEVQLCADDLCVMAISVFAGRIPAPAAENIKKIRANGAKVVLMAVYGNRAYDNALAEMKALCADAGFIPVAAAAVLAQNSIMQQVASTRPDTEDERQLKEFALKIKAMYEENSLPADVSVPGKVPEKGPLTMPIHPKADSSCVKCGICASKCPCSAIPNSDPSQTDKSKCITCLRCVEICPNHSRSFAPAFVSTFQPLLKMMWGKHLENEFYLG